MTDLVEIDRVSKSFGRKLALSEVSLSIPPGQICGLLGPKGAGKTTLFRVLMGLLKTSAGAIRIAGRDAFESRVEVKRLVGFLPDEPVYYAYLSGREILELSAGMHGLPVAAALARIAPLIEQLDLASALDQFADDYSREMKKKLGLLLALLHQPQLLVLDEPTHGLDVEATHSFYRLIHEQAQSGTTVVFSSHSMDQLTRSCSDAAILCEGRLVESGPIEALLTRWQLPSLEEVYLRHTSGQVP